MIKFPKWLTRFLAIVTAVLMIAAIIGFFIVGVPKEKLLYTFLLLGGLSIIFYIAYRFFRFLE